MHIALDFSGQHIVVFGGTTGINFGIASAFARQNANVTVASRKRENVDAACTRLAPLGRRSVRGGGRRARFGRGRRGVADQRVEGEVQADRRVRGAEQFNGQLTVH